MSAQMAVPLCRCRVLYIGSAVPLETKDGLAGIQQPLRDRYPQEGAETRGVDSWLSVWSNGLLLEYVDGAKRTEHAFFPIGALHYCAAVRYVNLGEAAGAGQRFVPLDAAPLMNGDEYGDGETTLSRNRSYHPPIFAGIFRKQTGVKVLECHAFICTNDKAANALVRFCFHAYANTIYMQMEERPQMRAIKGGSISDSDQQMSEQEQTTTTTEENRDADAEAEWNERAIGQKTWQRRQKAAGEYDSGRYDSASVGSSVYHQTGQQLNGAASTPGTAKKTVKKVKRRETHSDHNGVMVPYTEQQQRQRRASSNTANGVNGAVPEATEYDSSFSFASARGVPPQFARRMAPPPPFGYPMPPPRAHFYAPPPPPPPQQFGKKGKKPKHQKHPHPPQPPPHPFFGYGYPPFLPPGFFAGGVPTAPPHFRSGSAPPPGAFGRFGPPPPHFYGHPPPPPRFFYAHPMGQRPTSPDGPIITAPDSIYDTFPRRPFIVEEPIYTPHSVYSPESQYETYRRRKLHETDSDNTSVDDSQFWDPYDANTQRRATLGRKENIGEKSPALGKSHGVNGKANGKPQSSTPKNGQRNGVHRPDTPPADYELENMHLNEGIQNGAAPRQAAVF